MVNSMEKALYVLTILHYLDFGLKGNQILNQNGRLRGQVILIKDK
jgi:hypothetical protein